MEVSEQIRISDPIAARVTTNHDKRLLIRHGNHVLVPIQRNSALINQSFFLLSGSSGEVFRKPFAFFLLSAQPEATRFMSASNMRRRSRIKVQAAKPDFLGAHA